MGPRLKSEVHQWRCLSGKRLRSSMRSRRVFAGGYVSENERGTRTDGCVYEIGRARPFDVDEWCVNEEELLEGDMVDQKDGHGLAVLASRVVDGNQGASSDESAGFLGDGNAGVAVVR